MTNVECRMTNECQRSKDKNRTGRSGSHFGSGHWSFFRISSFGLRNLVEARCTARGSRLARTLAPPDSGHFLPGGFFFDLPSAGFLPATSTCFFKSSSSLRSEERRVGKECIYVLSTCHYYNKTYGTT